MGKRPCYSRVGVKKGPWTSQEDKILMDYVRIHGEGKWRDLAQKAGLKRCGKSCRLRWLNYLRPDIKLGNISEDEEDLIIKLHRLLGNRWTLIAGRLPGRSGNEIKNYWNTTLSKKVIAEKNKHNRLDAKLEERKADQHQPEPLTTPTSMQPNCSNPVMKSTKTCFNPPDQEQNVNQVELHSNETSFWEYISNISSLPVTENDDHLMSLWLDSDISQPFPDALDNGSHHEEHNFEDKGTLEDCGFSFDIFSNEP